MNTLTRKFFDLYFFQILYVGRCPPELLCYWNLIPSEDKNNCVRSQTTLASPKSWKCNISISNSPIAFKFYTEVKYLKLHKKMSMTRLTPKLHICWQHLYPPNLQSATQQAQLRWIHVESTSWPDVVSTLIFGSIWKLNQRLVFHVDSTSCFPLWFHVFSTLNPRVFNVESTWCFQRWINVRTPRGFHVDIWFYMKVDSMSSFQRWIYVMFSTLNPHNIFT